MEEDGEEQKHAAVGRHVPKRALRNKSLILGFDENDRREFVTGFHKRKKQRRKLAEQQQKRKEREKRIEDRKRRKLAIRLALGDTSGLPDEDSEGNSTRHMIEEEDDDEDPDHVSTVDGTFTYEDGDTTTIVKTCELQSDKGDIETPHLKSFPNTKSKSKVHIPVKKQKHFKRLRKGKKGMKGKKVNKDSSKRLGKRGKHKQ